MVLLAAAPPPGPIPGMDVTTVGGAALVAFLVVAVFSFTLLRGLGAMPLGVGDGVGLGGGAPAAAAAPRTSEGGRRGLAATAARGGSVDGGGCGTADHPPLVGRVWARLAQRRTERPSTAVWGAAPGASAQHVALAVVDRGVGAFLKGATRRAGSVPAPCRARTVDAGFRGEGCGEAVVLRWERCHAWAPAASRLCVADHSSLGLLADCAPPLAGFL